MDNAHASETEYSLSISSNGAYLRNEFHFSQVYGSVTARAKGMNSEGAHVNFASDKIKFTHR